MVDRWKERVCFHSATQLNAPLWLSPHVDEINHRREKGRFVVCGTLRDALAAAQLRRVGRRLLRSPFLRRLHLPRHRLDLHPAGQSDFPPRPPGAHGDARARCAAARAPPHARGTWRAARAHPDCGLRHRPGRAGRRALRGRRLDWAESKRGGRGEQVRASAAAAVRRAPAVTNR
jgi:hypothetical protein